MPNLSTHQSHTYVKCQVADCAKRAARRGWCHMHYIRWYKYGDPLRLWRAPNGTGWISMGYSLVTVNGRPKREHIYLAEKALGKPLPIGAVVHHMNGDRLDNYTPLNLVICPNQAYHLLLHQRTREYDAKLG